MVSEEKIKILKATDDRHHMMAKTYMVNDNVKQNKKQHKIIQCDKVINTSMHNEFKQLNRWLIPVCISHIKH